MIRRPLLSLLLLGGLLAGSHAARAQTTVPAYDPTVAHRSIQPLLLWPELQGELALRNGDYLLLALRGERSIESGSYVQRRLGFDNRRVTVAYEHFWNARWSWGGTARYESRSGAGYDLLVPELLVRHRSPIFGGLTFGQRLSLERQTPVNSSYLGGGGPKGQFWGRLRVDVERFFFLGDAATGLALRPRLSYEASTHLRFQKEANDPDERTIQYTSLRGEIGVRLSPHVDFTPWFAYQTSYLQLLVFTDASGRPVSGGKINAVFPTVGLDLRYTILPASGKVDRQQLPTQH
jgi:hypothetical protein